MENNCVTRADMDKFKKEIISDVHKITGELKAEIGEIKNDVIDIKQSSAATEVKLNLLLERLVLVDKSVEIQARHGEQLKTGREDRSNLWKAVSEVRKEVFNISKDVSANKAESKGLKKLLYSGPAWLFAGITAVAGLGTFLWEPIKEMFNK